MNMDRFEIYGPDFVDARGLGKYRRAVDSGSQHAQHLLDELSRRTVSTRLAPDKAGDCWGK